MVLSITELKTTMNISKRLITLCVVGTVQFGILNQWFLNLLSNQAAWAELSLVSGQAWFDRRFKTHGLWTRLQVLILIGI